MTTRIKTRFTFGDTIYYLGYRGEVHSGKVSEIRITKRGCGSKSTIEYFADGYHVANRVFASEREVRDFVFHGEETAFEKPYEFKVKSICDFGEEVIYFDEDTEVQQGVITEITVTIEPDNDPYVLYEMAGKDDLVEEYLVFKTKEELIAYVMKNLNNEVG